MTDEENCEGCGRFTDDPRYSDDDVRLCPPCERAATTGKPCRRCSECTGEDHHFIEDQELGENDEVLHDYACKHCSATAHMCNECDVPVWPAHDSELCAECRP